jgi:hypothetical protein
MSLHSTSHDAVASVHGEGCSVIRSCENMGSVMA